MPYNSNEDLPEYVKKYSKKLQSQFRHVFNSVWKKLVKEGVSIKQVEKRSFMAANSVLKKRFKEGQNRSGELHSDYFNRLIDDFLGNLNG